MVTPRTTPTSTAAAITPQNEPRPPITTTTNAAVRISAPIAGCTPAIGAGSTPASPPSPTPSPAIAVMYAASDMPSDPTPPRVSPPALPTPPNGPQLTT